MPGLGLMGACGGLFTDFLEEIGLKSHPQHRKSLKKKLATVCSGGLLSLTWPLLSSCLLIISLATQFQQIIDENAHKTVISVTAAEHAWLGQLTSSFQLLDSTGSASSGPETHRLTRATLTGLVVEANTLARWLQAKQTAPAIYLSICLSVFSLSFHLFS